MTKRGKKARRRLVNRISAWETMHADGSIHRGKVKIVRGSAYRKPGSLRK